MKKSYAYLLLLAFLCTKFSISFGQVTVVPGVTAAAMANRLAGPGVVVINPVLTCASNAYGIFSGPSTLSFDSGIVLTSGQAQTGGLATGANGPASGFASTSNGTAGDPQLTALAGQPTDDACILQFDFRPVGDTVRFQYVFGSEEYESYTCSDFNDVFGFFITGPGYASATNLAIVPGTGLPGIPVCINSVNCGATGGYSLSTCTAIGPGSPFCTYYVNNSSGTTITYDGLTTTLVAVARVTPCDTYHLKLGIADAVDEVLDSGVFLKAGSLTSISIGVGAVGINPTDTGFGAQYSIRGCTPGMFIFNNTGSLADSITIHYVIGGTGVNGIDYSTIADSAVIPAGSATDTVFINGLTTATGTKTVILYILAPYTCGSGPVIIDSVALTIYDSFYVHINTPDTAICIGQSIIINTSGIPSLSYLWSPAGTLSSSTILSPSATPTATTTYVVTASLPGSGCAPSTDNVTVSVVQPPVITVGPPVQTTCVAAPLQLGVTVVSGTGPYTYSWTPATWLNNTAISNPIATPTAMGDIEYTVRVNSSVFGCFATDSFLLHIVSNVFNLISQDTGVCFPPGHYQIFATGDTTSTYSWSPLFGVSDPSIITPVISPALTTTYTVTASFPGCPDVVHTITYSVQHPQVNIIPYDSTFCIGYPVTIQVVTTPADSPFTLTWTSPTSSLGLLSDPTLLQPDFYSATPGVFQYYITIQSSLGCTSSDTVILRPSPPIHVDASPVNASIMYGSHIQLQASSPSLEHLLYWWVPDNGTLNNPNINNPIATPTDSMTVYTVYGMSPAGCRDSTFVTIRLEYEDNCIPSAFTPNGDGLNDVFRLCNKMRYEKLVDFRVFNRWGQVVFENTNDPDRGWDGTFNGVVQDMGVYNYVIIIGRPDGTNRIFKGDVTLIK